jgi:hypothetical protein
MRQRGVDAGVTYLLPRATHILSRPTQSWPVLATAGGRKQPLLLCARMPAFVPTLILPEVIDSQTPRADSHALAILTIIVVELRPGPFSILDWKLLFPMTDPVERNRLMMTIPHILVGMGRLFWAATTWNRPQWVRQSALISTGSNAVYLNAGIRTSLSRYCKMTYVYAPTRFLTRIAKSMGSIAIFLVEKPRRDIVVERILGVSTTRDCEPVSTLTQGGNYLTAVSGSNAFCLTVPPNFFEWIWMVRTKVGTETLALPNVPRKASAWLCDAIRNVSVPLGCHKSRSVLVIGRALTSVAGIVSKCAVAPIMRTPFTRLISTNPIFKRTRSRNIGSPNMGTLARLWTADLSVCIPLWRRLTRFSTWFQIRSLLLPKGFKTDSIGYAIKHRMSLMFVSGT